MSNLTITTSSSDRFFNTGLENNNKFPLNPTVVLPSQTISENLKITLPSFYNTKMLAPSSSKLQEIFQDPLPILNTFIELPPTPQTAPEMYVSGVLLKRKRRIRMYHRRRRRKDNWVEFAKRHKKKKDAAEKRFRDRVNVLLAEAKAFDPRDYVARIVAKSRKDESIKIKYDYENYYRSSLSHWTENISVEDLYGLKKTDYIDKKSGLPSAEELEEIKKLRKLYEDTFRIAVKKTKKD